MARFVSLVVVAMFTLLTACESSFNFSTASLSEPAMSEHIDAKTKEPLSPADTFPSTVKTLYATIKLSHAPDDTAVKAVLYTVHQDNRTEIAQDTVKAGGTDYVAFSLNPPANGWPIGTYQVDYLLDNQVKESLRFVIKAQPVAGNQAPASPAASAPVPVAPAPAAPVPSAQAPTAPVPALPAPPPAQRTFRVFKDAQFGFSFELPDTWNSRVVGERSDYLFTGPEQSDDGEIAIIVQMIDTRKDAKSTLQGEMHSQLNRFSGLSGASILKKSEIQLSGITAPYFLATYPAADSRKQTVTFGHAQLGVQNGPIILLISYAAPRAIYQREVGVFQHMMDTTVLTAPRP